MIADGTATSVKLETDDNLSLAQMLRDACSLRCIPNNIKLPGSIRFHLKDGVVRMEMTEKCVLANMQANRSSFEGWALAFRRWINDVKRVEFSWKLARSLHDPHYQRFLFRVQQFFTLFPDWFSLPLSDNREALRGLRTETDCPLLVTSAKKVRETADHRRCGSMSVAVDNEHTLECYIKDHPEALLRLLRLGCLDRQLPVGLFEGAVKKEHEIFPRGHSAIDLWGIRGNELLLFELKAKGNTRVGILSELLFYSYVMEGVQSGRYRLQDANDAIASTTVVRSYILAPQRHPLIDADMLRMANAAFERAGMQISFGIIEIDADQESFDLRMPARHQSPATS